MSDSEYSSGSDEENVKTDVPCNNFRIDTEAPKFGQCKCGHMKADHGRKKANKASSARNALRHEEDDDSDYEEKAAEPCGRFRLDTTADAFAQCKCGWNRASHEKKGENHVALAAKRLKSRKVSNAVHDGPCDNFRVDTSADAFGVCVCGYHRSDHGKKKENMASEAVQALKKKNKAKNKEAAAIAYDRESAQDKMNAKREQMAKLEAQNKTAALKDSPSHEEPAESSGGAARGGAGCCTLM